MVLNTGKPSKPTKNQLGPTKNNKVHATKREKFITPTNPNNPQQKSRTIKLSAVDVPNRKGNQKILLLNNVSYDRIKIKEITADGKEVPDILGFNEDDVTLRKPKSRKGKDFGIQERNKSLSFRKRCISSTYRDEGSPRVPHG